MRDLGVGEMTSNPNFGEIIKLKGIDITEDPILWPYVKMQVYENGIDSGYLSS